MMKVNLYSKTDEFEKRKQFKNLLDYTKVNSKCEITSGLYNSFPFH